MNTTYTDKIAKQISDGLINDYGFGKYEKCIAEMIRNKTLVPEMISILNRLAKAMSEPASTFMYTCSQIADDARKILNDINKQHTTQE